MLIITILYGCILVSPQALHFVENLYLLTDSEGMKYLQCGPKQLHLFYKGLIL